jgi:predicted ATPase
MKDTMSLARLWREGPRGGEGRDLVAATLARFTQGFETADLVAARRLVEGPAHA